MAWLGLDAPNIASGWGAAPQLHAAPIGEIVRSALANRIAQQQMAQQSVADAIKTIQDQRQSQAYIQAAQQAGILPEGDLSGMGGKYASNLAQLIQLQKEREAQADYRNAMADYYRSGGRGSSGGGLGGKEWVQDADGNWHFVTGNAALRQAQGGADNPYEERFQMVTTPDVVTYWHTDPKTGAYSNKLDSATAATDPSAMAVLPNKVTMPYADYKKQAQRLVDKYYSYKTQGASAISRQQDVDANTPLPTGGATQPSPTPNPDVTVPPAAQTSPTPQPRTTPADQNVAKDYGRPLGPSQGGYQAGKTYGGRRYLGGDPNDQNNWQ